MLGTTATLVDVTTRLTSGCRTVRTCFWTSVYTEVKTLVEVTGTVRVTATVRVFTCGTTLVTVR